MAKVKKAEGVESITADDGRIFVVEENMSFLQDMYVFDIVHEMGLDEIDVTTLKGARLDIEAKKIVIRAYRTGHLFKLLGAMFRDTKAEPTEWDEKTAEDNAMVFMHLRDKTMKQRLEKNMVLILLSFFASGLSSTMTSQSFSVEPVEKGKGPSTEDTSTSGNGSPLSERSRRAIQVAEERLKGGRSVKGS